MKKMMFIILAVVSFGAQAMDLPNVDVKDRLRLELWSFGMEKVTLSNSEMNQAVNHPSKRVEIIKPLEELVLEL